MSVLSSTSSHPLLLASQVTTSSTLTSDSFVSILDDATDANEEVLAWHGQPGSSREIKGKGEEHDRGNIRSRVIHLQSPDVRSTYIRLGSVEKGSKALGLTHPYLHLAFKSLDQHFYFEIGVLDARGQCALVRASTFQVCSVLISVDAIRQLTIVLHVIVRT